MSGVICMTPLIGAMSGEDTMLSAVTLASYKILVGFLAERIVIS